MGMASCCTNHGQGVWFWSGVIQLAHHWNSSLSKWLLVKATLLWLVEVIMGWFMCLIERWAIPCICYTIRIEVLYKQSWLVNFWIKRINLGAQDSIRCIPKTGNIPLFQPLEFRGSVLLRFTRTLFFPPTLTPLWLISLTLMTHCSHTHSTVTHLLLLYFCYIYG